MVLEMDFSSSRFELKRTSATSRMSASSSSPVVSMSSPSAYSVSMLFLLWVVCFEFSIVVMYLTNPIAFLRLELRKAL